MEIRTEIPVSNIGAMHWLSELGMEDPLLLRSVDNRFGLTEETFLSSIGFQSSGTTEFGGTHPTFQPKEAQKSQVAGFGSHDSTVCKPGETTTVGFEPLSKIPKLSSRNVSFDQQFYGDFSPFSQPSAYSSTFKQFITPQQPQQSASIHGSESFMVSFSNPTDDAYRNAVPRIPAVKFEMGYSQDVGRQESSVSDVHSGVTTEAKEAPHSPSDLCNGDMLAVNNSAQGICGSPVPRKSVSHAQDHILAERKRREKLTQRFIALSSIVPGLKKMDKASVLGDAIKYVKHLQEQLKTLEEQAPKKVSVAVQKSVSPGKDITDANKITNAQKGNSESLQQPDIEVRMVDKNVLIRVHCEKRKSVLLKSLAELEKLQLSVVNANILSFSDTTLDLTFSAQMEEECELTVDDIVKALHSFFKKLK